MLFLLRLIEGMKKVRVLYRSVAQSDRNPLHTHHDYRQFHDIMPSSKEEFQVKQNILLAKAFGLIVPHENKVTGYDEIRFSYQDKQTGIAKVQVLGENWQKAAENLLSDQNRKIETFWLILSRSVIRRQLSPRNSSYIKNLWIVYKKLLKR